MINPHFHAGSALRRQRVTESNADIGGLEINGIDFLEVLDRDAPSQALRQRVIELHFLKSDGVDLLGPDNFAIQGGSRITGIEVNDVVPGGAPEVLRLTLNQAGDFSPYTLALRSGVLAAEPPDNMDRQLASVSFSFKVECPSDFDCKDEPPPAPARQAGPAIDYLTRDWAGFRALMLDRMSTTIPGFTERNPADLSVTLVEVLADAADKVSWFQDLVQTEAFFDRTRLPQSLSRHARLLGYRPGPGQNARTAVAVTAGLDRGPLAEPIIAKGTRFLTGVEMPGPELPTVLPRDAQVMERMVAQGTVVFEALSPLRDLRVARNEMTIHNWGDASTCLLPGATTAALVGRPDELDLQAGDIVIFEERIPFDGSSEDPPDPTHRQLVRLSRAPQAESDPVFGLDLTRIHWHGADALHFALPLDEVDGQPSAVVRGNVLLVDEGRRVDYALEGAAAGEDEIAVGTEARTGLLPDEGPGQTLRHRLDTDALVHAPAFDETQARNEPAAAALTPATPPEAEVSLRGDGELWDTVPDLLASDRFAPHVAVEPGAAPGEAMLRYGDGVLGRAPVDPSSFRARIRHGGGPRGNVGAGAIRHIVTADGEGIEALENPLPAQGGRAPQTRQAVQIAAPQAFRIQRRAVTASDYAEAAAEHPQVARAYGRRRWTGSWYTIILAIDMVGGATPDAGFARELRRFLESRRLAAHDLQIVAPLFVPLDIVFFACAGPDVTVSDISRDLRDLFSDRDLPNGTRGLFHPDALSFGEDIALSPLIAAAMTITGLDWIGLSDHDGAPVGRFARMDQPGVDYGADGVIPIAEGEIARLDNDPSRPELGRVRFLVEGGR